MTFAWRLNFSPLHQKKSSRGLWSWKALKENNTQNKQTSQPSTAWVMGVSFHVVSLAPACCDRYRMPPTAEHWDCMFEESEADRLAESCIQNPLQGPSPCLAAGLTPGAPQLAAPPLWAHPCKMIPAAHWSNCPEAEQRGASDAEHMGAHGGPLPPPQLQWSCVPLRCSLLLRDVPAGTSIGLIKGC